MENMEKTFWEMRSEYDRDTLFADPALLWTAAAEYFTYCAANPFIKEATVSRKRTTGTQPFMMRGMCLYLNCTAAWLSEYKQELKGKKNNASETERKLVEVITRIEDVIYVQKFSGAASGFFHAHMMMRDLGLYEMEEKKAQKFTFKAAE